jgi:hypothetical protein
VPEALPAGAIVRTQAAHQFLDIGQDFEQHDGGEDRRAHPEPKSRDLLPARDGTNA